MRKKLEEIQTAVYFLVIVTLVLTASAWENGNNVTLNIALTFLLMFLIFVGYAISIKLEVMDVEKEKESKETAISKDPKENKLYCNYNEKGEYRQWVKNF